MKISKYIHSCVLVEDDKLVVLFDPDSFTWGSKAFPLESLKKLDYILITHAHGDHFSSDFVKALVQKFPKVKIFTTSEVSKTLAANGIKNISTKSEGVIKVVDAPHEEMNPLTAHPVGENVAITFDGKVTHPGDSFQIDRTAPVLLLPIDGPWGSTVGAANLVKKVQPKFVLPIHDSMYHDDWQSMSYNWFEEFCKRHDIEFLHPKTGKSIEVEI